MVVRIDVLHVLLHLREQIVWQSLCRRDGIQSQRTLFTDGGERCGVQVQSLRQMITALSDVSYTRQNVRWKLMFQGKVEVVDSWNLIFVIRVPAQIETTGGERSVRRRREGRWKQIGLRSAILQLLRSGLRAERIAERTGICHSGAENQLRTKRRLVNEAVIEDARDSSVIENPGSAAHAGLAVPKNIPSEAHSWLKVVEACINPIRGDATVAREIDSWRGIGKPCGPDSGDQAR